MTTYEIAHVLDVACGICGADTYVRCHPVDEHGVHHPLRFEAASSHPQRFHAAGMLCAESCDDCPTTTSVIYTEWVDDV